MIKLGLLQIKIGLQSWLVLLVILLGLILSGCKEKLMIGGVQVNESNQNQWAKSIKKSGLNTIEVTVYGRNGDWDSKWMKYAEEEPAVLAEIRAAKQRGLKVVLILRQALDHYYPANKFLWHGMIYPLTEEDLNTWFETYSNFIHKWAIIAEKEKIEAVVIGSELNALSATLPTDTVPETIRWFADSASHRIFEERVLKYRDQLHESDLWVRGFPNYDSPERYIRDKVIAHYHWAQKVGMGNGQPDIQKINQRRKILLEKWTSAIKLVRSRYSGLVSYAANFDNYHLVGFWDQLDFIGINAYFPLRDPAPKGTPPTLSQENFQDKWQEIFAEINQFKLDHQLGDKPVFFTELGYTYRKNSTLLPWQGHGFSVAGEDDTESLIIWHTQPVDRQERLLAVRALYDAVDSTGFPLLGILYWKLTTEPHLIDEEPFALLISNPPTDSLQVSLSRFLDLPYPVNFDINK